MGPPHSPTEAVLSLAAELGMVRCRDLTARGIPHSLLSRLERQGRLERISRGTYRLAESEFTESLFLASVCARVPEGVVCLVSALAYHSLGTQIPSEVWMAIHRKSRLPRIDYPPTRFVRFTGTALIEGIETHITADGPVRVYSAAKTVVDCFRYRNKVGLDVALEALHCCLRERRATPSELDQLARRLRASNVMGPYLEASV